MTESALTTIVLLCIISVLANLDDAAAGDRIARRHNALYSVVLIIATIVFALLQ